VPKFVKQIFNYITIGIGIDKVDSEGLMRYDDWIASYFEAVLILIAYVIPCMIVICIVYFSEYFLGFNPIYILLLLLFAFNYMSESGSIPSEQPRNVKIAILIRTATKIFLFYLIYTALKSLTDYIGQM
jgi:hypothetical protein